MEPYDHAAFRDRLDAYVAGGLTGDERAAMEAHAAACPDCTALLAGAVARDASLRGLFEGARPAADFEDRLVERFRSAPAPLPLIHPAVQRAIAGVAAAVMLGGFGYVGSRAIEGGGLPTPFADNRRSTAAHAPVNTNAEGWAFRSKSGSAVSAANETRWGRRFDDQAPKELAQEFSKRTGAEAQSDVRKLTESNAPAMGMSSGMARLGSVPESSSDRGRDKDNKRVEDETRAKTTNGAGDSPSTEAQADAPRGFGGGGGMGGGGFGYRYITPNFSTPAPTAGAPAGGAGAPADGRSNTWSAPAPVDASDHVVLPDGLTREKGVEKAGKQLYALAPAEAFKPEVYFGNTSDKPPETVVAATVVANVTDLNVTDLQTEGGERQLGQQGQAAGGEPAAAAGSTPAQPPPAAVQAPAPAAADPTAGRKIIRNGEMSFEVDGFDSAYMQIVKIAAEEGGFVATTDSEKLANGKVRGVVTIRVPPERLDTLVLKLRGLGDLKSSRLAANDITKQYTDLESQLRASRAMEERLLNIIKTGKGEIKDLVEAEKQLGVYREKIEHVEGEIRYYNNLVSLSTLNVTLTERDIRTAAMLSETEQVNMGVEATDVEVARAAALKAIDEAKGRIIESDLKKLEAGQFAGKIVADVPPDAAGPLIDRMKQIGTVARLEVSRKQAAPEGTVAPTPAQGGAGVRVERRDTRFIISLYNLANVAPRQTTNLNLAAEDVEQAYRTILDQVKSAGGRIVTSQLNRPRPDQTTGTITFENPAEGADVLLGAVRAAGEVMRLEVSQNPDAQNVTEAKRGFAVQIFSIASVAPRETTTVRVAARGVADSFNKLREAVRATQGARVLSSQLKEDDPANVVGSLDFEVRRTDWATVETALRDAGQVVSRNVNRSADAENTVDTKVRLQVVLVDEAALGPRESVTVQLAVADVPGRHAKLLETLATVQARVLQSQLTEQEGQGVTGTLAFDVRRENRAAVDRAIAEAGDVVARSVARSTDTQNTLDDKVRLSLTLADAGRLPPRETTTLSMEASDVEKGKEQVEALALSLGGRVVESSLSRETSGRVTAHVVADVPLGRSAEMVRKTRDQGRVQSRQDARNDAVPAGSLARARVDVTVNNGELIVESGQGLWSRIRDGVRTSVTGLLWSVQLIVIGLFLVAPWALIVYFVWRFLRRGRARKGTAPATVPA